MINLKKANLQKLIFTMHLSLRTLLLTSMLTLAVGHVNADHIKFHNSSVPSVKPTKKATDKELVKYNKKLLQAYNKYKDKAAQVWGSDDAVIPGSTTDVTYRDNMKQRSVVDFEIGTINVEIAIKANDEELANSIEARLAAAIERTILQAPDERSILEIAENPEPPASNKPSALEGLIANDDGTPLTKDKIDDFKRTKSRRSKRRFITGRDGTKRVLITTQFDLVPNHIKRRAEAFRSVVDRNAVLHRIPAPLIYAIIETESMFNPRAKSPTPAFGLMQLVPRSGARDAYKYLFRKDKVVKEHYLYEPKNNIELGAAYLHLLFFRHFKHIKDYDSRQWATIAAYNAGTRNVYKSFSGKYTKANYPSRWSWKSGALKQINNMTADEVFDYLHQYLPAKETRDYLRKVRDRMDKYNI